MSIVPGSLLGCQDGMQTTPVPMVLHLAYGEEEKKRRRFCALGTAEADRDVAVLKC